MNPADPQAEQLRAAIRSIDGSFAHEGFDKTKQANALDDAVVDGGVSISDTVEFVTLNARLVGVRSMLEAIGPTSEDYRTIKARHDEQLDFLRTLARRFAHGVPEAFGL